MYQRDKVRERQLVTPTSQTKGLGVVSAVPMGNWNANSLYKKLNIVRSHSASYIAKIDNVGIEPTITLNWQDVWQVLSYDGTGENVVVPDGNYPQMSVGQATNDSNGNNIANQFESIRENIQNESHFRGYLETNTEIQALQATPNDYAYSAESGTVWIYQTETGWTNSGKPVPDQTIPKSTTLPLMDGMASIGSANAYSAGDHRHPSDVNKIDKSSIINDFNNDIDKIFSANYINSNYGKKIHKGFLSSSVSVSNNFKQVMQINVPATGYIIISARIVFQFANPTRLGIQLPTKPESMQSLENFDGNRPEPFTYGLTTIASGFVNKDSKINIFASAESSTEINDLFGYAYILWEE